MILLRYEYPMEDDEGPESRMKSSYIPHQTDVAEEVMHNHILLHPMKYMS